VKTTSESAWQGFLNIFRACPLRDNYQEKISQMLQQRLFGQSLAIKLIENAFRIYQPGRPLTFHFVGVCWSFHFLTAHLSVSFSFILYLSLFCDAIRTMEREKH
jgi:hypothetical protein